MDLSNQEVRNELFRWAEWLERQLPIGGLRLDAIKHMSTAFVKAFVKHAKRVWGQDCLLVGEYWVEDSDFLVEYVNTMDSDVQLYDIKLVHNFRDLSWAEDPDLRTVFDGSLARIKPECAFVSFQKCPNVFFGPGLCLTHKPRLLWSIMTPRRARHLKHSSRHGSSLWRTPLFFFTSMAARQSFSMATCMAPSAPWEIEEPGHTSQPTMAIV